MVTALYDGYINLSSSLFHGIDEETKQELMGQSFQMQTQEGVPTAVTTYLIDSGTDRILLNAGGAKEPMGGIQGSLHEAGYRSEDITAILLTHMHFDHVCGLVKEDGTAAFPNATVYVSQAESDFWLDPQIAEAAPEGNRAFFEMAVQSVAPYKASGRLSIFNGEVQIFPFIKAIPSFGHTPGHTSFLIGTGEDKILLWGDIVHSHALQFIHPEVTNDFDSDQPQAAVTRSEIFEKVAAEKLLVGSDHMPFPGIGRLRKSEQGYAWVPVEYAGL